MSTDVPEIRAKPLPRWSVVRALPSAPTARALLPAPSAGLPASRAIVFVGPPLSASGPSLALSVDWMSVEFRRQYRNRL